MGIGFEKNDVCTLTCDRSTHGTPRFDSLVLTQEGGK